MTDNNESHAEDEGFPGYTEEQEQAILSTLEAVGLKPDVNRQKILFSIMQVVETVAGGGAHPHHVLYESGIADNLAAIEEDVMHPTVLTRRWRRRSTNCALRTTTRLHDGRRCRRSC